MVESWKVCKLARLFVAVVFLSPQTLAQTVLHTFTGEVPSQLFGSAVAGAGDVNGDGFDDVVIGVTGDASLGMNSGAARVYSGLDGRLLHSWLGSEPGDLFGFAVAGVGDLNGDGCDDFGVGADADESVAAESGRAWIYSGKDGAELFSVTGAAAEDNLGQSVAGVGDYDGDGCPDLGVGVPGDDGGGPDAGEARIYSGLDGSLLMSLPGVPTFLRSEVWMASAGDVNGDGGPDLLVSFPWDSMATGVVFVLAGSPPAWSDLGQALAGTLGSPQLIDKGSLVAGSTTQLSLPFKGGVLVPNPDLTVFGLPLDPAGELQLSSTWPAGVPSQTEMFWQYWIPDAAGPVGFAASNAVRSRTP